MRPLFEIRADIAKDIAAARLARFGGVEVIQPPARVLARCADLEAMAAEIERLRGERDAK